MRNGGEPHEMRWIAYLLTRRVLVRTNMGPPLLSLDTPSAAEVHDPSNTVKGVAGKQAEQTGR